jgi:ADP-ribose pyrophosphatase YjhB (NUDIX family)
MTVRFCSACGSPLPSRPPVGCRACGTRHWRNPKPCANAIVVREETILLTKRAHAPWNDAWCSPGGFCNVGEHPIQTVVREVYEETGFEVAVTGYLGVWIDRYADRPDEDDEQINVAYYLAAPTGAGGGSPDPAEVSEVRWFGWNGLPEPLAPPGTLAAVLVCARAALRGELPALPDRPS